MALMWLALPELERTKRWTVRLPNQWNMRWGWVRVASEGMA